MKRIEKYIESVYKNINGNKDEIKMMKEEMKGHLLQTVKELESEGKSEDESINIAIRRFGQENEIEDELTRIFKFRSRCEKITLTATLIFLSLAVVSFIISIIGQTIFDKTYNSRLNEVYNVMTLYDKDNITSIDNKVEDVLSKYKSSFTGVAVIDTTSSFNTLDIDKKDLEYVYPKDIALESINFQSNKRIITTQQGDKLYVRIVEKEHSKILLYLNKIERMSAIWVSISFLSFGVWAVIYFEGKKQVSIANKFNL